MTVYGCGNQSARVVCRVGLPLTSTDFSEEIDSVLSRLGFVGPTGLLKVVLLYVC